MSNEEVIVTLRNMINGNSTDAICEVIQRAISAVKISDIVETNLAHTQLDVIDGYPTGNIYLGMTCDEYENIIHLAKGAI